MSYVCLHSNVRLLTNYYQGIKVSELIIINRLGDPSPTDFSELSTPSLLITPLAFYKISHVPHQLFAYLPCYSRSKFKSFAFKGGKKIENLEYLIPSSTKYDTRIK